MSMTNRTIYIIAELRKGCITQETYELVSFARAIDNGKKPIFLLLGKNVEGQAREISQKTGCDALVLMADHLEHYNPLGYAHALMEIHTGAPLARKVCMICVDDWQVKLPLPASAVIVRLDDRILLRCGLGGVHHYQCCCCESQCYTYKYRSLHVVPPKVKE